MENSPLSDRFVADEDDAVLDSGARDERYSRDRELPAGRTRPRGGRTRVRSWMRAGAVDWGIRIAVVGLVIGGFYALYVNGVAEGWWHAGGEKPSVAATTPATQPTPAPSVSSEAAMSGGYQIGPDGVLVRPAEFAADTYTKPELPEEAKENTERGAEAAAEHYLALMVYAWNTGDTQPLADMSDPSSEFASSYIRDIDTAYENGWIYGTESKVLHVFRLEPVGEEQGNVQANTIGVKLQISSVEGVTCQGQKITVNKHEYMSTLSLFMTWKDGRWIETQGRMISENEK